MTVLALVASLLVQAGPAPLPQPSPAPGASATRGEAEETTLDIGSRHIVERDYRAARALRLRSRDQAVSLDVGAALEAGRIDVTLHNVRGRVRFHASAPDLWQRLHLLTDATVPAGNR
jgi:hypothetical protein